MANVKSFKVNGETIDVFDKNSVKMLSEAEKATLISTGTYKGSVIANNSIFTDASGVLYRGNYEEGKQQLASLKGTFPMNNYWQEGVYGNGKLLVFTRDAFRDVDMNMCALFENGTSVFETILDCLDGTLGCASAAFGNNTFVIMGAAGYSPAYSTNIAAYSTDDGDTWIQTTLPSNNRIEKVTYGNNKFIAIPYSGFKAVYSSDGATWTEMTLPGSGTIYNRDIIYANGTWVITRSNSTILTSTDGSTWTEVAAPKDFRRIAYNNGVYIAANTSGDPNVYRSTDLEEWTAVRIGPGRFMYIGAIAVMNGNFVLFDHREEAVDTIYYSSNGTDWSIADSYRQGGVYYCAVVAGDEIVAFSGDSSPTTTCNRVKFQTALLTPLTFTKFDFNAQLKEIEGYTNMPMTGRQKLVNEFGQFRWVDEEME